MRNFIFFFILSAVLVFLPSFAFAASQAALFLNPASGIFLVGSTFDVSIVLDTKGTSVNTAEVELIFPPDKIQVANPSIGKSIIQLWPAPPTFSNNEGRIYFVGGIPSPGIVTTQGVILTLTFRVMSPGDAEIKFGDKTSILANDGRGTDILGQKPSAFYKFQVPPPQGPPISSPTHPDQERWYQDPNPLFIWSKSKFADGYAFAIDQNPSGFPSVVSKGIDSTASFQNLENGIWYFHLRERAGGIWGGVSHYVVKIDNQPPASFGANVSPSKRTTDKSPIFRFFTTDALSGLSHYEMKIIPLSRGNVSEALFFEASSPYQAVNLEQGRYQVVIRAIDGAGNARDEPVALNIVGLVTNFIDPDGIDLVFVFIPWRFIIFIITIILIIFIIILFVIWRRHKHHLRHAFFDDVKKFLGLLRKNTTTKIIFFFFIMLGAAIFSFASFVNAAINSSQIPAPVISVAPDSYYPLDEILYIEGRSAPSVKMELLFEKVSGGSQPVRSNFDANSNGEWYFSQKLELPSGEWSVRARASSDLNYSDWSNPRIIRSVVSGFAFGSIKIRYLPIAIFLSVLIIFSLILFFYALFRVKKLKNLEKERAWSEKTATLEKDLREKEKLVFETTVNQNFNELRRRVNEELEHLDKKASIEGRLSPEESGHKEKLLRELKEAEEDIAKKLKQM